MKNTIQIFGDVAEIVVVQRSGNIVRIIVDADIVPSLQEFNTVYVKRDAGTNQFYASVWKKTEQGQLLKTPLHRFILNAPQGMLVDHINHDTLDNRRENLRLASQVQNQQNRISARRDNKSSGIRGVSWNKSICRWVATVRVNGKRIHVGAYKDINLASQSVQEARKNLMEFSPENMEVDARWQQQKSTCRWYRATH